MKSLSHLKFKNHYLPAMIFCHMIIAGMIVRDLAAQETNTSAQLKENAPQASTASTLRIKLQGIWEFRGLTGAEQTPLDSAQRWTFDGDRVTIDYLAHMDQLRLQQYHYHLDDSTSPSVLILYQENGLRQFVVRVDANQLALESSRDKESDRPGSFTDSTSPERKSRRVIELTRVSEQPVAIRDETAHNWEDRAIQALISGNATDLPKLAAEFRQLPERVRRTISLSVKDQSVEMMFRGEVQGDQGGLDFVEFLVTPAERSYESLMLVAESEIDRMAKLQPFFAKHRGAGRSHWWQARLIWVEDGKPHSADLEEIFGQTNPRARQDFLDGIEIDSNHFLGGEDTTTTNLKADRSVLPRHTVPATLVLTLKQSISDTVKPTSLPAIPQSIVPCTPSTIIVN